MLETESFYVNIVYLLFQNIVLTYRIAEKSFFNPFLPKAPPFDPPENSRKPLGTFEIKIEHWEEKNSNGQ